MEDNKNMSAERSLEIIRESIERSQKDVTRSTARSMLISGLATIVMSALIGIICVCTKSGTAHLLWFLMPIVIWIGLRLQYRNSVPAPKSYVGMLVGKVWKVFAIVVLTLFACQILWLFFCVRIVNDIQSLEAVHLLSTQLILLLMGCAIATTGYVLRSSWLKWCGFICAIGGYLLESYDVPFQFMSHHTSYQTANFSNAWMPCVIVALFAFVGLVLPGLTLKGKE
jgi:hypothetical protein